MIMKYIGKHHGRYYKVLFSYENRRYWIEVGTTLSEDSFESYEDALLALLRFLEE